MRWARRSNPVDTVRPARVGRVPRKRAHAHRRLSWFSQKTSDVILGLMKRPIAFLIALLVYVCAHAQVFPGKPIRLIVSYPPGGGADLMARLIAPRMSESLGQPVIVENKPGASGQIAAGEVARAPADGYTLLFDASNYAVTPWLFANLPYEPAKAFRPIAVLALFPNV